MKISKVILQIVSILFLLAGFAVADMLYPVDDMYIDTINTGGHQEGELYIGNDPNEPHINEIMMKFDLSAYQGMYIDEALLWVYRYYGCSHGDTRAEVYHIDESWDESSWPIDQYISRGGTMWSDGIFNNIGWNVLDVSYLINAWTLGDMINNGLVICGQDGARMSKLYSAEAANGFEPYLQMPEIISVDDTRALPLDFGASSYPNPFNSNVNISYTIQNQCDVKIEIYNLLGQHITTLVDNSQAAGYYSINWDATGNPTGVYFYRITAGDITTTQKMLYLK